MIMLRTMKLFKQSSFICIFLRVLPLFSMEDDLSHASIMQKITSHNLNLQQHINNVKNKDVIFLIGRSNAGKSTLANYLIDPSSLKVEKMRLSTKLSLNPNFSEDPNFFTIGHYDQSCTTLPQSARLNNTTLIYDLPGLIDSRGSILDMINSMTIKSLLTNAQSARFMFVLDIAGVISDNAEQLKNMINFCHDMLPEIDTKKYSLIIITKESLETQEELQQAIAEEAPNSYKHILELGWQDKLFPRSPDATPRQRDEIFKMLGTLERTPITQVNLDKQMSTKLHENLSFLMKTELTHQMILARKPWKDLNNKEAIQNYRTYFSSNDFLTKVSENIENSDMCALLQNVSQAKWSECIKQFTDDVNEKRKLKMTQVDAIVYKLALKEDNINHLNRLQERQQKLQEENDRMCENIAYNEQDIESLKTQLATLNGEERKRSDSSDSNNF